MAEIKKARFMSLTDGDTIQSEMLLIPLTKFCADREGFQTKRHHDCWYFLLAHLNRARNVLRNCRPPAKGVVSHETLAIAILAKTIGHANEETRVNHSRTEAPGEVPLGWHERARWRIQMGVHASTGLNPVRISKRGQETARARRQYANTNH
jgi:hypothetical protein